MPSKTVLEEFRNKKCSNEKENILVIIDDLMVDLNAELCKLFTIYSHHMNISVMFLVQNLFYQQKFMRTITLNSQYLIIFNNKRDVNQIRVLGNQLFSGKNVEAFQDVYKEIVKKPFSYMLIDIHPESSNSITLRTNVLPNEIETVYTPRG